MLYQQFINRMHEKQAKIEAIAKKIVEVKINFNSKFFIFLEEFFNIYRILDIMVFYKLSIDLLTHKKEPYLIGFFFVWNFLYIGAVFRSVFIISTI
ncbi:hypothetical protein CF076_07205 [Clostridium botulinum]|nr:hypothetical protein RSJ19_12890 [Clostridium botulinum]MBN3412728.1 hypothetical protein [Clostridium botulinum]OSA82594.1 hypothetical protein B2H84_07165 [Clostridium botulinum]